jgi:hypothetical protein
MTSFHLEDISLHFLESLLNDQIKVMTIDYGIEHYLLMLIHVEVRKGRKVKTERINQPYCYPIHTKEVKSDSTNDMVLGLRGG